MVVRVTGVWVGGGEGLEDEGRGARIPISSPISDISLLRGLLRGDRSALLDCWLHISPLLVCDVGVAGGQRRKLGSSSPIHSDVCYDESLAIEKFMSMVFRECGRDEGVVDGVGQVVQSHGAVRGGVGFRASDAAEAWTRERPALVATANQPARRQQPSHLLLLDSTTSASSTLNNISNIAHITHIAHIAPRSMWPDAAIDLWLQQVAAPPRGRKRALTEMSSNVNKTPTKRNVAKRPKKSTEDFAVHQDDEEDELATTSPTPRQQHPLSSTAAPALDQPSPTKSKPPSPLKSVSSVSTDSQITESSGGRKRKRQNSRKTLAFSQYEVRRRPLPRVQELPDSLRPLVENLADISQGEGVISKEFTDWKDKIGSGIPKNDERILDTAGKRAGWGEDPELKDVHWLVKRALRNTDNQCSEASWNSFVHGKVLDMAYRLSSYQEQTMCEDM